MNDDIFYTFSHLVFTVVSEISSIITILHIQKLRPGKVEYNKLFEVKIVGNKVKIQTQSLGLLCVSSGHHIRCCLSAETTEKKRHLP